MNILIAEGMQEAGINRLKENGFNIFTPPERCASDRIDILIVRSVFKVNAETLGRFKNLKCVAKLGTGLDNIDLDLCAAQKIEVINAPGMNSRATAEFVLMQILNVYKNNSEIMRRVKKKDYRRAQYYGRELASARVGIIGYGSVGRLIAERIRPFVGADKVYVAAKRVPKEDRDKWLGAVDIIICAVNLAGNEHMVDDMFLSKVKKDVLLVNAARGGIIDEAALMKFLKANPEAVYCCDVLKEEPDYTKPGDKQDYRNPLLDLSNVIYTPHIAGMTGECQADIAVCIAEKIVDWKKAVTQAKNAALLKK